LQIDASGHWLAASNYGTGNAALYPIQPDGSLGEMSSFVQHEGQGPNQSRQEGPHAHSTTFTPDNQFAIVADLGIDQLVIYKFDAKTGTLNPHVQAQAQSGAGPRHLAFHPNGTQVYVANELNNTVSLYDYNGVEGTLLERQAFDTLPSHVPENTVADIHISASGQHVYISNRGHDSLVIYKIGGNGQLTRLGISSCHGKGPRNFAISPSGQFILVANRFSDEISVLPLLADGAELGTSVAAASVTQPSCIKFVIS
jgi:6-phosphogluconolactonase